jgi:peptidoglycan/xylan/chitin deacetylase (PgdA/CDA1 family)
VSVRTIAKRAGERLLVASGIPALALRRRSQDALVLAYHNVVPDDAPPSGDGSLHLARSRFAAQLDALARTHRVVPLREALEQATDSHGRPRAVITFDDAYQGALTLGVAELVRRGLPATVFVAPQFVGGGAFWWDRFAVPTGAVGADFRSRALDECAGRDEAVAGLAARNRVRQRDVAAYAHCASEAELSAAARTGHVALGSHSWSHANLAALAAEELHGELNRPLAWLRERFDSVLPVLAYPYGRYSDSVVVAAREAGYVAALRIDGGWLRPKRTDPLRVPRLDVPSAISSAGFALRASGMFAA